MSHLPPSSHGKSLPESFSKTKTKFKVQSFCFMLNLGAFGVPQSAVGTGSCWSHRDACCWPGQESMCEWTGRVCRQERAHKQMGWVWVTEREGDSLFPWGYISLRLDEVGVFSKESINFSSFCRLWMCPHLLVRLTVLFGQAPPLASPHNPVLDWGWEC